MMSMRLLPLLLIAIVCLTEVKAIESNVETYFLAVSDSKGIAIPVIITVERLAQMRGFSIDITGAKYDASVISSFKVALYALANVCNVNISGLYIRVVLHGYVANVKGPSASLAFAYAILLALGKAREKYSRWAATGVLQIDGIVDAVAGTRAKIDAANKAGVKVVLIPLLNENQVQALAHKYDISIERISSLLDLCKYVRTSQSIEVDKDVLAKVYRVLRKDIEMFNKTIMYWINALSKAKINVSTVYVSYIRNASRYIREGKIYSAASLLFTALIHMATKYGKYVVRLYGGSTKLVNEAAKNIEIAWSTINSSKRLCISVVPFLISLLDRIEETKVLLSMVNTNAYVYSLIAWLRSKTALTWLKMLTIANSSCEESYVDAGRLINASLDVLKTVGESIEVKKSYPLTLTAIADLRATLLSTLNNVSRTKFIDALENVFRILVARLDPIETIVPHMYWEYAHSLDDIEDRARMLSLATLIAGTSIAVTEQLKGIHMTKENPISVSYVEVYERLKVIASCLGIASLIPIVVALVVEHRVRRMLGT